MLILVVWYSLSLGLALLAKEIHQKVNLSEFASCGLAMGDLLAFGVTHGVRKKICKGS